jgi:hypothetical protein
MIGRPATTRTRRTACALAGLPLFAACAARTPPQLTPETDTEVASALRGIPAGGASPQRVVDVKPEFPGSHPSGRFYVVAGDGKTR